jgi:hypothetical protein
MKWFLSGTVRVLEKAYNTIVQLWKYGYGHLYNSGGWLKIGIDTMLITGWTFLMFFSYTNIYVSMLGIAIIMSMLSRTISFDTSSIFGELVSPFISIALYSLSVLVFWWSVELAWLVGLLVLPCVTREISENYSEYYLKLSPKTLKAA